MTKNLFVFVALISTVSLLGAAQFPTSVSARLDARPQEASNKYLSASQANYLESLFVVHSEFFLNDELISKSGLPLTAYKIGDRGRFGYSNPTEWGYALQAWIAAAERGLITQADAVSRITAALATMQSLQADPSQNHFGLFYPFYTLTDENGVDLPSPINDSDPNIPSGDLALLYASLVVTEGWASERNLPTIVGMANSIEEKMDFRPFLFNENGGTYLAHQINANTGQLSASKWDIFSDEGGVVAWIFFLSESGDLSDFKALSASQRRGEATWQACDQKYYFISDATWFNAMFSLGVRSLAGYSIGQYDVPPGSRSLYSKQTLVPATEAHIAYGDCLGIDYPAFSDAMTQTAAGQALVGRYTPPNLPGIAPIDPPGHIMPHAFFIPLNALPDLPLGVLNRLIDMIQALENDAATYFHDSGQFPFGFEVTASPYADVVNYQGADDGRPIFETLSQSYIFLSLFNALQLDKDQSDFYHFASLTPDYEIKLRQVLEITYPNKTFLPLISRAPCLLGEFRFGSGTSPYPEAIEIPIEKSCLHEGENTLVLESAVDTPSNQWLFWDSLYLRIPGDKMIWQLGINEAPPDYSDRSFDEFDTTPPFDAQYFTNTLDPSLFPAELNDLGTSAVFIHFNLEESQLEQDLLLFLDTLFATHTGAPYFDMRVRFQP